MNSEQHLLDEDQTKKLIEDYESKEKSGTTEDSVTNLAFLLWINSQNYKQNRMNRIALYERLYNNQLPPKERQLFNICLPILAGFEDALAANIADPIQLRFSHSNPAYHMLTTQVQSQWEMERDGLEPHQLWNSKSRDSYHDALLSGRSILKLFPENDPTFRTILERTSYSNFHCQPLGGKNLENHLFCGEEGIYMTMEDIETNESFPQEQREKIKSFTFTDEWWQNIESNYGTLFARFKSMGLDVMTNTFSGSRTLYLNQFVVTYKGVRWYTLFDPLSQIWLQCEPLVDLIGTNKYPWDSAATHEDADNFWSKSFSDDIFQVAVVISTLLNQELTSREKANFRPRAYDPTMFDDASKLDASQYMPDRLIPVNTNMGTRKISDGIYSFETGTVSGTIDLVQWMRQELSSEVGISDLAVGADQKKTNNQKAQVMLAQQQQLARRIGFKAESFKEMWGRMGERYLAGLVNFMPASLPVKILGENGITEQQELKRLKLKEAMPLGIKVISKSSENQDQQNKKQARVQSLTMVKDSPNINSQWRDQETLLMGEWSEEEIKLAMDTQTYGSKKQVAKASQAIQDILGDRKPVVYFGCDMSFMNYIHDFAIDNRELLEEKKKIDPIMKYSLACAPYAKANMIRKAKAVKAGRAPMTSATGQETGREEPGGSPKSNVLVGNTQTKSIA